MMPTLTQSASVRFRTCIPPVTNRRALAHFPRGRRRAAAARGRGWGEFSQNLITDVGLDMPASYLWRNCFLYFAVGTGTRPTKRDSGTITASRTGTAVTASADFFEAGDVGRTLKLDSGAVTKITVVNSATVVTVADSGADAASEFTVWYGNDSTHEAEYASFSADLTGTNERTTAITGATITLRRTGISTAFAAPKQLREIGWRPTSSGNLFGRALIPGGGDSVAAGQQYKVQVELSITVSPATATAASNVGTGCDTAGSYCLEAWGYDASGTSVQDDKMIAAHRTSGGDSSGCVEPSTNSAALNCCTSVTAPRSLSTAARSVGDYLYNKGVNSAAAYVAGSRRRVFTYSMTADEWSGTITGVRVGVSNGAEVWRHTFATPITKTNLQTFSWSLSLAWDRVLNN